MKTLFALLFLLKIIGIVLLCLLAVLLLVLIIILFTPIKYRLFGEKFDKLKGGVWVSWLFGILQITGQSDGSKDFQLQVKVFGIVIMGEGKKQKKKKEKKREKKREKQPARQTNRTSPEDAVITMRSRPPETASESPISMSAEPTNKPKADVIPTVLPEPPEHRRVLVNEIKEEIPKTQQDQILEKELPDDFFELNVEDKEENKEKNKEEKKRKLQFLKSIPNKKDIFKALTKLIKSLMKGVLPNAFYFQAKVGIGDPAFTGYLCGVIGVMKMQLGNKLNIVPNFSEMCFEDAQFKVMGKIVPGYLLYALLRFILTKPVWRTIISYWKGNR